MTVWLMRVWTYKNADEKLHTFSRRSKNVKKRTKTDEKRILCQSTFNRSDSCKQSKGNVIKRTIAGVQSPYGTALIACHLTEHKPPVSIGMMSYAFSRSTNIFAILPKFFKDLLQIEDLDRGAATRTKTALAISNFVSTISLLFLRYLTYTFPSKLRSADIPL